MKLLCCAVVLTLVVAAQAQLNFQEDAAPFPDYWGNDYDDAYDYPEESNDGVVNSQENLEVKQDHADKLVEAEIQDFRDHNLAQNEPGADDGSFDALADYQFEDNRSDADDKDAVKNEVQEEEVLNEEPMPDDAQEINPDDFPVLFEPKEDKSSEDINENDEVAMDDDVWGDIFETEPKEEVGPLPVPVVDKESLDDDQVVEDQDINNFDENLDENEDNDKIESMQADLEQIFEEANKLLEESDNDFNADDDANSYADDDVNSAADDDIVNSAVDDDFVNSAANDDIVNSAADDNFENSAADDDVVNPVADDNIVSADADDNMANSDADETSFEEFADDNEENETPEKVLDDLNADLDKLFETLGKLSDDSDLSESNENVDKNDDVNEVRDYEEKYDRPYKEGNILSLRDDYDNFDDSNLSDIFNENADNDTFEEEGPIEYSDVAEQENAPVNENDIETTTLKTAEKQEALLKDSDEESFEDSDDLDKLFNNSDADSEQIDELLEKLLRHSYGNDGLVDDEHALNEDAELIPTPSTTVSSEVSEETRSTMMVENLNSAEYNDLMNQFAAVHSEDLDVNSEIFAKNVAPIHITLSVDEPTIITSPNYPNAYPTNNIVDWIIEGPGTGIELNITDFYVNGAMGDYVLVKPGGIDASGTDGLIFSFRLNHERRYRFTNVNRMFVRFEAKLGMQFATGFSFSARMIWPLPEITNEEIPQPEPVIHPPTETMVLSLAGLTLQGFNEVRTYFKALVADMAEQYIVDNEIERGINTTLEVTQITKTAVCNIRWPNYETCVEVTFGVPLHYEHDVEEHRLTAHDLDAMWRTYIAREPYASRLREMGITEYAIPDDHAVLMLWMIIAIGVIISMAVLAFVLWRFRCFEDYTRMMAYNDTDSIQKEKRTLDLYPTPHQTLPPLYSDTDYKWADDKYDDSTRVDMGGFANKSYVRDNLFDFDSDEDIITPRDRKPDVISSRDVYQV